jgi:fructose transport system ATP-binding protein
VPKKNYILEVKKITKHFGGVCALDNVDLELVKGEILGLVGDNGAGKSTLVKIITGAYEKDSGEIYFEGKKVEINNPTDAKNLGIETIYQDLALLDHLDVPVNIFLGREYKQNNIFGRLFGFMNFKKMNLETINLMKKLDIDLIDIHKQLRFYSGGQRQAVAFSKIVYWGKKLAILDEPTAALGVRESKKALALIKSLKDHGLSVIIISHNLQHIFSIVDRIMVLRRGKRVGIRVAKEVTTNEIVSMITGAGVVERV